MGIAWSLLVIGGFILLARYSHTPGASAAAASQWPQSARTPRSAGRPTLLVFLHPRCPCSRATLAELDRLVATCGDRLGARAVFVRASGMSDGWEQGDLWNLAHEIPGVAVLSDPGGCEARLFGANTSGQAFLFSARGQLLFSGGITGARGHAGDNAGRSAILAAVSHTRSETLMTPVYGCPLFTETDGPTN